MNEIVLAATFGGSSVLTAVVWLVVLCIVWLAIDYFKVPPPMLTIIRAVLVIGAIVILIRFLLSVTGTSMP